MWEIVEEWFLLSIPSMTNRQVRCCFMNASLLVGLLDHPDSTVSVSFWCQALCLASSILLAWWRLIIKPESVLGKPNSQTLSCRFSQQPSLCFKFKRPTHASSVGLASSPKGRAERLFCFCIIFQVVLKVVILDLLFRESNQEAKLTYKRDSPPPKCTFILISILENLDLGPNSTIPFDQTTLNFTNCKSNCIECRGAACMRFH